MNCIRYFKTHSSGKKTLVTSYNTKPIIIIELKIGKQMIIFGFNLQVKVSY